METKKLSISEMEAEITRLNTIITKGFEQSTNQQAEIVKLRKQNERLIEAIKLMKQCSNYEEAKSQHGDRDTHWTRVIEKILSL